MFIRKQLKMFDRNRFYYNPASTEESQKRITILPEKFDEEIKKILRDQLSGLDLEIKGERRKFFYELDQREANDILVKSSPQDVQSFLPKSLRADNEITTLFVFPPAPQKGGIQITTDDYCCLEEEQFLNDVILDFYLKYLMLRKVKPEVREKTHVFSTFFYKRLTSKPKGSRRPPQTEEESKLTPAQKRHARVQSWTKNVDIFSKDFILIPINEHSHWFLAVICYPGLDGPVRCSDGKPVVVSSEKVKRTQPAKPKEKVEQIPVVDDGEWSDRDEAEGDEEELNEEEEEEADTDTNEPSSKRAKLEQEDANTPSKEEDTSNLKETKRPLPESKNDSYTKKEEIIQPCILIFDSLSGASRSRIVATLRDYLTVEHQKKKNKEKPFTKDTMKGACPKVPQQTNFSDCGLFTLQFAESFFENPLKDFKLPIKKTLLNWFSQDDVAEKRKAIADLIKSLMDEQKPNHNITLPQIHFNIPKEKVGSGSPDNGKNEMKANESSEGVESKHHLRCDEYLQDSHQQSVMPQVNRTININLIQRNTANAVAVPSESQRNEVANASANFSNNKREVIFNIGPASGNIEMAKGSEISNRGTFLDGVNSKTTVNKCNNSAIDHQISEEDKIGKSPRRIEIKDDSDLLLVFNTDPNSKDDSQVTEINIQSSDSSPELSASYKSIEEESKSKTSHTYGSSSEESSSKLYSSGHQTFTPVRNIIYQTSSTGSTSQGMVTTTPSLHSTVSCASMSHEKMKYANAKFSKSNQNELRRQSVSENCSSSQLSYLNEEQLLLPGAPRCQLKKERLTLQQRQQQHKNLNHQQMIQEKKTMHEKSGMKSAFGSEVQISENPQQPENMYQTNTLENQNKINFSQNKHLTQRKQQELMHKHQLQHEKQQQIQLLKHKQKQLLQEKQQSQPLKQRELLRQKQQQHEEQIRIQLQRHRQHLQEQQKNIKQQQRLQQLSQDQPLKQQQRLQQLSQDQQLKQQQRLQQLSQDQPLKQQQQLQQLSQDQPLKQQQQLQQMSIDQPLKPQQQLQQLSQDQSLKPQQQLQQMSQDQPLKQQQQIQQLSQDQPLKQQLSQDQPLQQNSSNSCQQGPQLLQQNLQGLEQENIQELQQNSHNLQPSNRQQLNHLHQHYLQQQQNQKHLPQNHQQNLETVHEIQNSKQQQPNFQELSHKDHQRLQHQERLRIQEERIQQHSVSNQLWQDQEEVKQNHLHSEKPMQQIVEQQQIIQPQQQVTQQQQQQIQLGQHLQKENVQRSEQKLGDVVDHLKLDTTANPEPPKVCAGNEAMLSYVQKFSEETSSSYQEEIMQVDNEDQRDVQYKEQRKQLKRSDKQLGGHEKEILGQVVQKKRNLELDKYNNQVALTEDNSKLSKVDKKQILQNAQSPIRNSKSEADSPVSLSSVAKDCSLSVKDKNIQKTSNVSNHELETITKDKSVTSTNNSLSSSFSQPTPQTSAQSVSSRGISASSPALASIITMQTPTPSRTTSRGRVVNTPMKYRDLEDVYVSSKRSRGSVRGSKVKNSRISDPSLFED